MEVIALKKLTVRDIALIPLMSVLIALCAWVAVPFTVPFTLQTLGVFMALKLLGGKKGSLSILIYILLGVVGVPVFAGFTGGVSALMQPTGGYIVGFLITGLLYWLLENVPVQKDWMDIFRMVAGLLGCYALGTAWFWFTYATKNAMGMGAVLMACVVPFLIPDGVKIALAYILGKRLQGLIHRAQ